MTEPDIRSSGSAATRGATPGSRTRNSGFSLVELLVVIGIIALLTAFIAPAFNSISQGYGLTQAAQTFVGELGRARQIAIGSNRVVQVRVYRYTDPGAPGSTDSFRALQLFQRQPDSTFKPLGKVVQFGSRVVMSDKDISSLASLPAQTPAPADRIPRAGTNFRYIAFAYHPDGSTDLGQRQSANTDPQGRWYLSLIDEKQAAAAALSAIDNYVVVQIQPTNGILRLYRP